MTEIAEITTASDPELPYELYNYLAYHEAGPIQLVYSVDAASTFTTPADMIVAAAERVHRSERLRAAHHFADQLRRTHPDLSVAWTDDGERLTLTVIVKERELERELALRALLIQAIAGLDDPSSVRLRIRLGEPVSHSGPEFGQPL